MDQEPTTEPQVKRTFKNTLAPHDRIFTLAEKYTRLLRPTVITALVMYFMYLMSISVIGGGLTYTYNFSLPVIYAVIIIAVTTPPTLAFILLYHADKHFLQKRREYVEEFLTANGAVHIDTDLSAFLEPYFSKYTFNVACKKILKQHWLGLDIKTLTAAYYVREARELLYPALNNSDAPTMLPLDAYWIDVSPAPIILFGSKEPSAHDWVAVAPLAATTDYSSLYVDILGNGSNIYLDQDEQVRILQLEGSPYTIYTGTGGGSDAYLLFSKLSLEWLKETDLQLDFELFNNRLIIRQSLPSRNRFGRRRPPETLFNPTTIQNIYNQICLLKERLERHIDENDARSQFTPFSSSWHNSIAYSRNKYILSVAKKWTAFTVLYVLAMMFVLFMPVFILVIIQDLLS